MEEEIIHIGFIKFFNDKGYGFIIDFLDNSEIYFQKTFIVMDKLPDIVVSFKVRKSQKYPDKYDAYDIASLFYYKKEIMANYHLYPKEVQDIITFYLPSIICKEYKGFNSEVETILKKCEALIKDLYDYVNSFDIEEFLKAFFVTTDFYNSASTKDWDINRLSYESYYVEPYSKLESIYRRCVHYDESLVWESHIVSQEWYIYKVFDPYISKISSKSERIKRTTAYGYDTSFWNDLNMEEIESKIPEITNKWKSEIRQTYNKRDHIDYLINQIRCRFNTIVKRLPTIIDDKEEMSIYVCGKDGNNNLSTYVCPPQIDVMINCLNGSIHFVGRNNKVYGRIGYEVGEGYEYCITRQLNGEDDTWRRTIPLVSDDDFTLFRNHFYRMRNKTGEMFSDMIKKYLIF